MSSPTGGVAGRAADATAAVKRRVASAIASSTGRPADGDHPASGWLVVTVLREPSDVETGELPGPLAELGERIEIRVGAAPGDRGTELAARLRDRPSSGGTTDRLSGADPQSELRSALRQAKQLLEVGEVLAVDPTPHGDRKATPGGALLEAWTKVADKGGVR
jgi:hypothetical protein